MRLVNPGHGSSIQKTVNPQFHMEFLELVELLFEFYISSQANIFTYILYILTENTELNKKYKDYAKFNRYTLISTGIYFFIFQIDIIGYF